MLKRKQPLALPKSSHSKFILFYYERPRGRGRPNLFLSVARATSHESHVHLDLLERSNNYRICEWDVLDVVQSAALAAKKAAAAANALPALARDVPLPHPRPVVTSLSRHRREHFHEATRGPVFNLISPLRNYTH